MELVLNQFQNITQSILHTLIGNTMNYLEARPHIKTGDLIAFGHDKWKTLSDLEIQFVMAATQSEYSHVATALVLAEEIGVFVIEAVVPEVRPWPLSKMGNFYWIPMGKELSREALELLLSKIGHKYSKKEAILAFFDKNDKTDDKTECAELFREIAVVNGTLKMGKDTPSAVVYDAQALGHPVYLVTNNCEE